MSVQRLFPWPIIHPSAADRPAPRSRFGPRLRPSLETLEPRHLLAGDVILHEIMYHPSSGNSADEWIELYNRGDQPVDLTGWRISDGVDFTFSPTTLPNGGYLVVAANREAFGQRYPQVTDVVGDWLGRLSNSGERIELVNAFGSVIDSVVYSDSGDWAVRELGPVDRGVQGWRWEAPHDGEGSSLELVNAQFRNDLAHNWSASRLRDGTPAAPNSVRAADIAPAITDVSHQPIVPTSADAVIVTARVVDEQSSGVTATLYYRVSTLQPDPFQQLPMHDDGQHGDGAPGDGQFGAAIPPQADSTVVEFYIQATDTAGNRRTLPAATNAQGEQDANLLYQVDDTIRPDDIPLYRVVMTVPELRRFQTMDRFSDAQMNATFIATVGGQTEARYNVGVRYRGSGTRTNNPTNNRINIPADRAWQGFTQININANRPENQIAGSALFALARLPAADAWAVRMLHNGTDLARGGYYTHLEVLNSEWADRHFPRDSAGNVYRGRRANEGPPGGLGASLQYFGEDQSLYVSYVKGTNRSEADYSDVVRLTRVLNTAPDDQFIQQVSEVVDIDEWLRTMATIELTGYGEFSLLTGDQGGDDYAMYRPGEDPRFLLMPYDLDDMFQNARQSFVRATGVAALNRLLRHPQVTPRYYQHLLDLSQNVMTEARVRPVLEAVLAKVQTTRQIDRIILFLRQRADYIRSRIPRELTAASTMNRVGDYYRTTTEATGQLQGNSDAVRTRRVEVNGLPADWDHFNGRWSVSNVPLRPGINRIIVRAFDDQDQQIGSTHVDVWRDTGQVQLITGEIATDTVWTAQDGPYRIAGQVTVAAGVELRIEPGTSVYFSDGARLTVRGRLVAIGTEDQTIRLTRDPNGGSSWNGLQLVTSREANRIEYAVIEYGVTDDGMIGLERSNLQLEHVVLDHTPLRRIRSVDSSLVVRNSTFTNIFDPGQAPATNNMSEHIWGQGILADGQWLIEGNTFGHVTGHNDHIDFDAPRLPRPIPIIRNNVFVGGGDDALDLTGDAYIEGNTFRNFTKDQFNNDPGESNTISASGGDYWVIRNVFDHVDHAALVKENAFMALEHNTVISGQQAAVYFDLPGQTTGPGRGARIVASIFAQTPVAVAAVLPTTELTIDYSLVPAEDIGRGEGNLTAANALVGGPEESYRPLPGSPAIAAGRNGADLGAQVPPAATISGVPPVVTSRNSATLTVAGPAITHYRYRLTEGPFSDPVPVEQPIELRDLADGTYTVEVIGLNPLGEWQDESAATRSRSWTVDSTLSGVRISEILAANAGSVERNGTYPDLVELYNPGRDTIDLSGMSLTDDPSLPIRFVFPAGTTIGPHEYLVLLADREVTAAGLHLGFGLAREGDGLWLYDRPQAGGELLDSVQFGLQVPGLSIGLDDTHGWTLTRPTFGAANQPVVLGDVSSVRVNEWLSDAEVVVGNDFFELFNSGPAPVQLDGLYLTDNPLGWPQRHQIPPLSFIPAAGFATIIADGDPQDGPDHVDFRLSRIQDMVGLLDPDLATIDLVRWAPMDEDGSMGRLPDSGSNLAWFALPTPGQQNSAGAEPLDPTISGLFDNLRITEVMYNPLGGSDYEFIEFSNTGSETLNLAGVRLSDAVEFTFPDIQLQPGQFIVVAGHVQRFQQRYGADVPIAGQFSGNLGNGGESLRLRLPQPYDANILAFEYADEWYRTTDGGGFSLAIRDPLGPRTSWQLPQGWRPSHFVGGSPGAVDAGIDAGVVVINEVLAHTESDSRDAIELHNTATTSLTLDGWYLSNDAANLPQYRIPTGTTVPPGGYVVFTAAEHFGQNFSLRDHEGMVLLASPDAVGSVAGYIQSARYGAAYKDTSFGRYQLSHGTVDFVAQQSVTLGGENSGPLVGPIVVNEVMYNPQFGEEFIELHNISGQTIQLSQPDGQGAWSLAGDVSFTFPPDVTLSPGGYLVISPLASDQFRTLHPVPDDVPVLGPYGGSLSDDGGKVMLVRPGQLADGVVPMIVVDQVNYDDQPPWPVEADGGPSSLSRIAPDRYGNDPINWQAGIARGTPGSANRGIDTTAPSVPNELKSTVFAGPTIELAWQPATDPETGIVLYRIYRDSVEVGTSNTTTFLDQPAGGGRSFRYHVTAVNGQGLESDPSLIHEVTIIQVISVVSRFADQLILVFSEPLVPDIATDPSNYSITADQERIQVLEARLADTGQMLTLRVSPLTPRTVYQLQINGLRGVSGNVLPPDWQTTFEFIAGLPGWTVRGIQASEAILPTLSAADQLLGLPNDSPLIQRQRTRIYPTIHFLDDDGHVSAGLFPGDVPFPTDRPGDDNHFLIHATGLLDVTAGQAGQWTFGVHIPTARQGTATLVPFGTTWKYLDDGSDQGTAWLEPAFDDSAWPAGPAQLGYGDGDEATVISFGGNSANKFATTYFRHTFELADASLVRSLSGQLVRDDGAAVYLNGVEVARQNLRAGAPFNAFANNTTPNTTENDPVPFTIDPSLLVNGTNVLAVEVHQANRTSSDVSFDFQLAAELPSDAGADGFRLLIDGTPVLLGDVPNTPAQRLGTVTMAAGPHTVDFLFFEKDGPAEIELFAAQGSYTSLDHTQAWRLVGDTAPGSLRVVTDPLPPVPINWDRVSPGGSYIFGFSDQESLPGGSVAVRYTTDLIDGQSFTVAAQSTETTARLSLVLRSGTQVIAAATSPRPGAAALLPAQVPGPIDQLVLEVSSDVPTGVRVQGLLSSVWEEEAFDPAARNDTPSQAQSIGPSLRQFEQRIGRWAARGQGDGAEGADWYAVSFVAGDVVSASVSAPGAQPQIALFRIDGRQLAAGTTVPGAGSAIADYMIPADGEYLIRVNSAADQFYSLLVSRNAGLELLGNEQFDRAPQVPRSLSVLGSLGGRLSGGSAGTSNPQQVLLPIVLTDGDGFFWDIGPDGSIGDGTDDAYDGGLLLDGFFFVADAQQDGRQVILGPQVAAEFTITRKIYVPAEQSFARFLEVITNTSAQPQSFAVQLISGFGSDDQTFVVGTSSGDAVFDSADNWLVTDDGDAIGDPTLTHVVAGPGGLQPVTARLTGDELAVGYTIDLAPGETRAVLHFAAQSNDQAAALQKARTLEQLGLDALKDLSEGDLSQIVNFVIQDQNDHFALTMREGQQLAVSLQVPRSGRGSRVNRLQPIVELYAPDQTLIARQQADPDDGQPLQLGHTSTFAGEYRLRVTGQGEGEYILQVVTDAPDPPALEVRATEPALDAKLSEVPELYVVHFSSPVDLATADPADLTVNGIPALRLEPLDGDSLRFLLDPAVATGEGTYVVHLTAGALANYYGADNEDFITSFEVDHTAPRLVRTFWNEAPLPASATIPSGPITVRLELNEAIRDPQLETPTVSLQNDIPGEPLPAAGLFLDSDTRHLTAIFPHVPEGRYTLIVSSGDGQVEDLVGNDLDGEPLGRYIDKTPSGNGQVGGDYRLSVLVEDGQVDIDNRMVQQLPLGSLIAAASLEGEVSYPGDIDAYRVSLVAGEPVDVALLPQRPDGAFTVTLRDPWGRSAATITGQSPRALQLAGTTAAASGVYTVEVTSDMVGAPFRLQIVRGAVDEVVDAAIGKPVSVDATRLHSPIDRFAATGNTAPIDTSQLVWGVQPLTGSIIVLDPDSGNIVRSFSAPGQLQPQHRRIGLTMADLGQSLLYVNADADPTLLYRLHPLTGEVQAMETLSAANYDGLAFDAGRLFLSDSSTQIVRQSATGDPPLGEWATGQPVGALGGDDYGRLFGMFRDGLIHEFDPNVDADQFLSSLVPPAADIEGLAFDGRWLYASTASGSLWTLDPAAPSDQLIVRSTDVAGGPLFALAAATEQSSSGDGIIEEQEPNHPRSRAQDLDPFFSLAANVNIGDQVENTSTRIPHVTINGTGDGSFDYYSFSVSNAGDRGFFDVDFADSDDGPIDSYLRLLDARGATLAENDDGPPSAGAEGSSSGLDSYLEFTFSTPGRYTIEVGTCCVGPVDRGGTYQLQVSLENHPLVRTDDVYLVSAGSVWKYWDRDTSPGLFWVSPPPLYDDSNWQEGRAQLGYGDGDERTVVSFGPDPDNKLITTYFRHTFTVQDPGRYSKLTVDLVRDDGAVVYLNSFAVVRDRVPQTIDPFQPATGPAVEGPDESTFYSFDIDPALLQTGQNILSVEVRQQSPSSDDLSFDLQLRGQVQQQIPALPTVPDRDDYSIDLSEYVGQSIDLLLTSTGGTDLRQAVLELRDPSGLVLASGTPRPAENTDAPYDVAVLDFTVPAAGRYGLRVRSDAQADYTLLLVANGRFELEPNDSRDDVVRSLSGVAGVMGYLSAPQTAQAVDPAGDTVASGPDIAEVSAEISDDTLTVTLRFHNTILPSSPTANDGALALVEIDVDQNPATGRPSLQSELAPPGQQGGPLGVEYVVGISLNEPPSAEVFPADGPGQPTSAELQFDAQSIVVRVPLDAIGFGEGTVNLGLVVGVDEAPTDYAPDTQFLTPGTQGETAAAPPDWYSIDLEVGQTVRIQTQTPRGELDPALALYDAAGNQLASDEDSWPDGRNAFLQYTAQQTGTYHIAIRSSTASGPYVLTSRLVQPDEVAGRFVFYNNSSFDGHDAAANDQDDASIAYDKTPLLPGGAASVHNYTSYVGGINGVMIDLPNVSGTPSLEDFQFHIGNTSQPALWQLGPPPTNISLRRGAGVGQSDRVTMVWPDGAIQNQWLRVIVKANEVTGLSEPDVFYFGNAVGETGDAPNSALVDLADEVGARRNPRTRLDRATVTNPFDFNRDGTVDATDQIIARRNRTGPARQSLLLITTPPALAGGNVVLSSGDANGDGLFTSSDLVLIFQAGEFEDKVPGNSVWQEGDFNGDGEFDTKDLILAFRYGGYAAELSQDAQGGAYRAAVDGAFAELGYGGDEHGWVGAASGRRPERIVRRTESPQLTAGHRSLAGPLSELGDPTDATITGFDRRTVFRPSRRAFQEPVVSALVRWRQLDPLLDLVARAIRKPPPG